MDDAVLSCGGLIYDECKAGKQVEIWTLMAGIPNDQPADGFEKRLAEDLMAVSSLGARPIQYEFIDALYRTKDDGTRRYDGVFSPINIYDADLLDVVTDRIRHDMLPGDSLFCPLAVGEHVDHLIVRRACESLGIPFTYYIDFPYVDYVPEKLEPATRGLTKHFQGVSGDGLKHWMHAACMYKTQELYKKQGIMRRRIYEYWSAYGPGIYLWRKE